MWMERKRERERERERERGREREGERERGRNVLEKNRKIKEEAQIEKTKFE